MSGFIESARRLDGGRWGRTVKCDGCGKTKSFTADNPYQLPHGWRDVRRWDQGWRNQPVCYACGMTDLERELWRAGVAIPTIPRPTVRDLP